VLAVVSKLLDLALFALNDNAAPKGGVWCFMTQSRYPAVPADLREAVLSSKIEGTQVTLGKVLEFEAQGHLLMR
jgi:hypothetical protein